MKRLFWASAIIMGLAVVGCGPAKAPETANQVDRTDQTDRTDQAAAPQKAQGLRIAVVPKGFVHEFWLTVKAGAEAAAQEHGASILWNGPNAETDVAEQISIIEDMLNQKVDALVMAACNEVALVDVVAKAHAAGIPVVTIDSGVKSDLPISYVATDNVAGARKAAEVLAKLVGEAGPVGLIPFVQGAATSEMREQGFKDGLSAYPNVQLVATLYSQSDVAKGMAAAEDMMTAHPDLKGIFAANESGAMGAVQAIEAAGKAGQIKVVAFDSADREVEALQSGSIDALIVQNPFQMGFQGVKAAIDSIQGKPVEKRIDTGVTVVTRENMNEPEIQKLLHPLKK